MNVMRQHRVQDSEHVVQKMEQSEFIGMHFAVHCMFSFCSSKERNTHFSCVFQRCVWLKSPSLLTNTVFMKKESIGTKKKV